MQYHNFETKTVYYIKLTKQILTQTFQNIQEIPTLKVYSTLHGCFVEVYEWESVYNWNYYSRLCTFCLKTYL